MYDPEQKKRHNFEKIHQGKATPAWLHQNMSGFFLTRKKLTFRNMLERLEITKNSKAFDQGLQIDQKLFALHNVQHLFDKHSVMSHFYRQRRTILVALLGKFPWLSLKTFNNDIFSIGVNASKKFPNTHTRTGGINDKDRMADVGVPRYWRCTKGQGLLRKEGSPNKSQPAFGELSESFRRACFRRAFGEFS